MAAMPFESSLVVLTMTGNQLREMFDHGISKFTWYGDPEGSFLQVSGMAVGLFFSKIQYTVCLNFIIHYKLKTYAFGCRKQRMNRS